MYCAMTSKSFVDMFQSSLIRVPLVPRMADRSATSYKQLVIEQRWFF